jgi:hypothetical protein
MLARLAAGLIIALTTSFALSDVSAAAPWRAVASSAEGAVAERLVIKIKKDKDKDNKFKGDPSSLINDPPPPNDLSTKGYPFSIANPPAKCSGNICEISFVITNGNADEFKGEFGFNDTVKIGWVQKNVMMPVLEPTLVSQSPAGWTCASSGGKVGCSAKDFAVPANSTMVIPLRIKFKNPPGVSASFVQHAFFAAHNGNGGKIGWAGTATSMLDPPLLSARAKSDDDRADFEGKWDLSASTGTQVKLKLKQDGKRVSGGYTPFGGTVDGTVSGNTMSFKWTQAEPAATGTGTFQMLDTKPKSFKGSFAIDGKPNSGGAWNGVRSK